MMVLEGISSEAVSYPAGLEKDSAIVECRSGDDGKNRGNKPIERVDELNEGEREELELLIDKALDQCFFCLYGFNILSYSSYDDNLDTHKKTSRGGHQTKEQRADVFQYILPRAKGFICICICELSFCFKSSCSSFTINMWEIDEMGWFKMEGISSHIVLPIS